VHAKNSDKPDKSGKMPTKLLGRFFHTIKHIVAPHLNARMGILITTQALEIFNGAHK
jgi:hypothetical protein